MESWAGVEPTAKRKTFASLFFVYPLVSSRWETFSVMKAVTVAVAINESVLDREDYVSLDMHETAA